MLFERLSPFLFSSLQRQKENKSEEKRQGIHETMFLKDLDFLQSQKKFLEYTEVSNRVFAWERPYRKNGRQKEYTYNRYICEPS